MSTTQQTPNKQTVMNPDTVRRSLAVIAVAIVVGTMFFVWQSKDHADRTIKNTKAVQTAEKNAPAPNTYANWTLYKWKAGGVSLKYPNGWFLSENTAMGRLYIKNSQVDLLKDQTPENFQQVWLSVDPDETLQARETAIKNGKSEFREVDGAVKASTIAAGGVTVNVYTYNTVGGPTLEAYWTNRAGTRVFATTSTEVGQQNQTDMVATLKKLLATVSNL